MLLINICLTHIQILLAIPPKTLVIYVFQGRHFLLLLDSSRSGWIRILHAHIFCLRHSHMFLLPVFLYFRSSCLTRSDSVLLLYQMRHFDRRWIPDTEWYRTEVTRRIWIRAGRKSNVDIVRPHCDNMLTFNSSCFSDISYWRSDGGFSSSTEILELQMDTAKGRALQQAIEDERIEYSLLTRSERFQSSRLIVRCLVLLLAQCWLVLQSAKKF